MKSDLSERVGLPVTIDENNRLEFGEAVDLEKMSVRSLADLAVVAADENLELPDEPAYYMYRNVRKRGDEEVLRRNNLRFDITVIPPTMLGEEYIKTSGHYHPLKPGTASEYPELYYVVSGQASYLMQKHTPEGVISDVILARVPAGTAIMMPPFYGHITINELDQTLVMANWVEMNFGSVYGDYEEKRGGAYYVKLQNPNDKLQTYPKLEINRNYGEVAELRVAESVPMPLSELAEVPFYQYSSQIEKIAMVASPEKYLEEFRIENWFRFL